MFIKSTFLNKTQISKLSSRDANGRPQTIRVISWRIQFACRSLCQWQTGFCFETESPSVSFSIHIDFLFGALKLLLLLNFLFASAAKFKFYLNLRSKNCSDIAIIKILFNLLNFRFICIWFTLYYLGWNVPLEYVLIKNWNSPTNAQTASSHPFLLSIDNFRAKLNYLILFIVHWARSKLV